MQGLPYDFGADLWSIGIVYYQMLFGKFPFQARTTTGLLERTRNHDFSFEGEDISENAKDFISKCLKFDPEQRLTWI
jgi:serine/threonine protein kinase